MKISELRAFIDGLRSRGVTLELNGPKNLTVVPFAVLSAEERITLRENRQAIRYLVMLPVGASVVASPAPAAEADSSIGTIKPSAPLAPTCAYCGHRPCLGPAHEHFALLHHNDPAEEARRQADADAEMLKMIRFGTY